mgnify:CR=1 FL=1
MDEYLSELSRCRKCRFCIDTCPTFRLLDNIENRSPYGRIQILKYMLKGFYDVEDSILHSVYTCLICTQCNVVCGKYGEALEVANLVREGRSRLSKQILNDSLKTPEANMLRNVFNLFLDNVVKKHDPVGLTDKYWTKWANGLKISGNNEVILYTSRMYQMIPYLDQVISLLKKSRGMLRKGVGRTLKIGTWFGMKIIGLKLNKALVEKTRKIVKAISVILDKLGVRYGYLYDTDVYSGALLYDLGLDEHLKQYVEKVYKILKKNGVKKVITIDPHTYHIVRDIYPEYIDEYDLEAVHYIEVLSNKLDSLKNLVKNKLNYEVVIHDPCTMSRILGVIEEPRLILEDLGIKVMEPKNNGLYTRCCGGPIEYAYPEFTSIIATERVNELKTYSNRIVTSCPICLMNFIKHSKETEVEVYDFSEILSEILTL